MKNEEVGFNDGTLDIEAMLTINHTAKSIGEFRDKYPDAQIISINGTGNFAICEGCSVPIFAGQVCYLWDDSVVTCRNCGGENENHKFSHYLR